MPLIRLSGKALCRHTAVFCARRCLENMKKVEADRLLDLHSASFDPVLSDVTDPDIAAAPEFFQIPLLRGEQLFEALVHHTIHSPLGTAAELFRRSRGRGVVKLGTW